jgi:hypothetical protein
MEISVQKNLTVFKMCYICTPDDDIAVTISFASLINAVSVALEQSIVYSE